MKRRGSFVAVCSLLLLFISFSSLFAGDDAPDLGENVEVVEQPGENWGTLSGRVFLDGKAPDPNEFPMSDRFEKNCNHEGSLTVERLKTNSWKNSDGEAKTVVKDAVVFLKDVNKALKEKLPPEKFTIDQKNCLFKPSVGLVRANGTLVVKNSDPTIHNFNYNGSSSLGISGNEVQPQGAGDLNIDVKSPEFVTFRCNMHPWMLGMVRVAEHHAYALTDEKGAFSFQVPPGSYTLVVHHLKLDEPKEISVEVPEGKSTEQHVTLGLGK